MVRCSCGTAAALLILTLAVPAAAGSYYLYSPRALDGEEIGPSRDGVLVREIEIRKGDTLSGLSRRFSGRGSYYPQILLFNDIRNPNLIFSGAKLRVPVTRGETTAQRTAAPNESTTRQQAGSSPVTQPTNAASPAAPTPTTGTSTTRPPGAVSTSEQHRTADPDHAGSASPKAHKPGTTKAGRQLFKRAVRYYRRGKCITAIALFDRFLSANPSSPLAADANLYKADCYLRLSTR